MSARFTRVVGGVRIVFLGTPPEITRLSDVTEPGPPPEPRKRARATGPAGALQRPRSREPRLKLPNRKSKMEGKKRRRAL